MLQQDISKSAALAHVRSADEQLAQLEDGALTALDDNNPGWLLARVGAARQHLQLTIEELQ